LSQPISRGLPRRRNPALVSRSKSKPTRISITAIVYMATLFTARSLVVLREQVGARHSPVSRRRPRPRCAGKRVGCDGFWIECLAPTQLIRR
jgi:hypothetical protein